MNFLWIDCETTGLFTEKHDIVQLACIPVINGKRHSPFNEFCQPLKYEHVEPAAVKVHGITVERMRTFQTQEELLNKFIEYLDSFGVKFTIAGFNVSFDKKFLSSTFSKNGKESKFFELFELHTHDTYNRAKSIKKQIKTDSLKLEALANYFNVKISAHEALSDIGATIEVDRHIGKLLNEEEHSIEVEAEDVKIHTIFPEPAQLHLHSMYGLVESVPTVEEWAEWCANNNVSAFSIVDHGYATSLYGMTKIREILDDNKRPKYPDITGIPGVGLFLSLDLSNQTVYPVNAWAVSNSGYFNLIKLSSIGFENSIEVDGIIIPRITVDDFLKYKDGLFFGTGDVYGAVGNYIADGDAEEAERAFSKYIEVFGDRLFVEFIPTSIRTLFSLQRGFQAIKKNKMVPDGDIGKAYTQFLAKMVDKYNLRCIPSSGAHFINKEDKLLQDCLSRNSYNSGKCYSESYHVKKANEMFILLKKQLGDWLTEERFLDWINNTHIIANMAKEISISHSYHMPKIDIPDHIKEKTDDYDKQTYYLIIEKCMQHGRWNNSPEYIERFKKEIDVIWKNDAINFLPYFLMYEDICSFARSNNILQNIGRGSAGGCLLSYYLKIIHIDPIAADLPFERFLSHPRIKAKSFPDIDVDFGDRSPIVSYLEQKYGAGFAQISTHLKMKTKLAIKDAMFALYGTNREDPVVKSICELIPDSPQGVDEYDFLYGYIDEEETYHPGVVEVYSEVRDFFAMYPAVEAMVKRLIGVVRGIGRHPSAFVISTLNLSNDRIPIVKMFDKKLNENINVTQYDAKMCEGCGLVKADILGVTTIQAISDCINLIKERTGLDYMEEDEKGVALIYRLPEDRGVYRDFYNKKTDSSFQFNTSLIKGYVQRFAPTEREHLSALTALCRPGALDAAFSNNEISLEDGVTAAQYYMDVRNGERKLSLLHDDLASCTTNGIFVFQEEIMKFLVDVVGYTLEESDQIRSAIAKKKHEVMMSTFSRIRSATSMRGWKTNQTETICNQVLAFSRYSFNKSHSRCYAELGYITMFLKHHHELEWWASVLNNTKKEDKLRHYMTLLGDKVAPPSLNTPSKNFSIQNNRIVAALSAVKSVGDSAIDELVSKGPFSSLDDYIKRVSHNKVNIGHFTALIKSRAVDCLMDSNLPYSEARKKIMDDYVRIRKSRPFDLELSKVDPVSVFLMEKDTNKCFNKSLLDEPSISVMINNNLDELEYTGKRNIPFFRGVKRSKKKIPIVSGISSAKNMLKNGYDGEVGLVLLFESSTHKHGNSKKTGKPYDMVKAELNDGYSMINAIWWDRTQPLRYPKNSIVFVRGTISEGWGGILNIQVSEMEKIENDFLSSKEGSSKPQ